MENCNVSKNLDENIQWWKEAFSDCADIKMLEMCLGEDMSVRTFLTYIEITGGESMLEKSAIGSLLTSLTRLPREEVLRKMRKNGMGVSDAVPFATMQEAADGLLAGECILFFDGFDRAVKIPDKGYPAMSLQEVESEKSVRGSNERFSNS
ncbi:MAG: spore germination protein, partial [Clostridiales bacterium]|nr:spore germination protein [Clostridiales bacterium]